METITSNELIAQLKGKLCISKTLALGSIQEFKGSFSVTGITERDNNDGTKDTYYHLKLINGEIYGV